MSINLILPLVNGRAWTHRFYHLEMGEPFLQLTAKYMLQVEKIR